jgi:predicted nucleic acid-binding protein
VTDAHRPRAVLDTDIIYSRVLHDLTGRAARDLRLLSLFWSNELLAEARNSLEQRKRLPPDAAQRWVDYLPQNFPSGHIDLSQAPAIDLASLTSDPADAHVCALAIAANADYLLTHDHGYLRDGLARHNVQVITPDELLAPVLDSDARSMLDLLHRQAGAWAGGRPIEELLTAIERAGAPTIASKARLALSL